MTKRMLIDATQPEETRVVMTSGNRVEDFDFEVANRRQLKGNIYLARVTRVEPSLQAAFVEYGGNRHGFLAFNEIHPDYYRIPMEDREALLAEQAHEARDLDEDLDVGGDDPDDDTDDIDENDEGDDGLIDEDAGGDEGPDTETPDAETIEQGDGEGEPAGEPDTTVTDGQSVDAGAEDAADAALDDGEGGDEQPAEASDGGGDEDGSDESSEDADPNSERKRPRSRRGAAASARGKSRTERSSRRPSYRRYKIQEVVTRRQIMLVQVVKEERGNKGAALTTFLSLAGRYCVLMPNTPRGGGVSRKITNAVDRKRLKQVVEGLDVPEGMAVIVRTAGSQRTKTEIKRDYEYLLRLWDQIREATLVSTAPCLVHEEANLIKRSIRDLYARDIDEVLVEGEDGYRIAKSFMKTLMPSHARRVQRFAAGGVPLFSRFQVEGQLDAIHASTVQLRSGGYIVMNQTEALVAIDVNSGRSTRERNIEETALKTNLEAAEEVARQLRLRDLAGLIVIDFIDMDESRNQHAVERKMKEVVKSDRARIQLGRISQFGLMELSRQRLRPSVAEASTQPCPHCEGTGRVRSIDSAALQVLRNIEEEGLKQRASEIAVHLPTAIGFYVLNRKRDVLAAMEERYAFRVTLEPDDALIAPEHRIDRLTAKTASERNAVLEAIGAESQAAEEDEGANGEDRRDEQAEERRPRRRRRRSDRSRQDAEAQTVEQTEGEAEIVDDIGRDAAERSGADEGEDEDGTKRRRRRGKRGGRRRSRRSNGEDGTDSADAETAGNEADAAEEAAIAEPADTTAEAPAPEAVPESADEAAGGEAAPENEETPKPRKRTRRPRRRKDADAETAGAQDAAAPEPETQPASGPDTEAPESNMEPGVEQVTAPAESEPDAVQPQHEPAPLAVEAPETGEEKPKAETVTVVEGVISVNGSEEPSPPRRGWWNRLLP